MANTATTYLVLERVTKGAALYKECDERGILKTRDEQGALTGSIYLRKAKLQLLYGQVPERLTLSVASQEGTQNG